MKVVLLAGGRGLRINEESHFIPKPMVQIGGRPLLEHILQIYSFYGFNDFIICCGYKSEVIINYFKNFADSVVIDQDSSVVICHQNKKWKINLVDTGLETQTGGRLLRIKKYITEAQFMMTYGDGLADINLNQLLDFHNQGNKMATVTAVHPPSRFGAIEISENGRDVQSFKEKPQKSQEWINGGYFVLNFDVFNYIENDLTYFEREPLSRLALDQQLQAFKHEGFWQCMDTYRDKVKLEEFDQNSAPWMVWKK